VSFVEVVLALVKILIVIGFCLNMSALTTWADRRQSAMIQHRVGPNRAVINLPSFVIQGVLAVPGLALGGLAALGIGGAITPAAAMERMALGLQLTIFVVWFHLVVLAWRVHVKGPLNKFEEAVGSTLPRSYFYAGLFAHGAGIAVTSLLSQRLAAGLLPAASVYTGARLVGALLGGLMAGVGIYAAMRIPKGTFGLRLAGTLHALADSVKMIFKEDFVPKNADKLLHSLAPMIAIFPALVVLAVVPFGSVLCFEDANKNGLFEFSDLAHVAPVMTRDAICAGHAVPMQIADLNVGILYLFAISSTGVIGAAIAGWSSDNKFSLLGGLRAASQMVSYEVAMGLSIMGLLVITSTLRLQPLVDWQNQNAWGVFVQPLGFLMFLAATAAETKRVPFDQPEGESEIVAGYFVEYSGFKWGMFMAGEYVEVITSSAILITLFFGGYSLPFLYADGVLVQIGDTVLFQYKMNHVAVTVIQSLTFFGKTILMAFFQVFFRWTLPRFRYDQLMKFGWTKLLPLAIANLVVTGVAVVAIDQAGAGVQKGFEIAGQLTHLVVAFALVAAPVALIWLMLRPVERTRFLRSTSTRFSAASGGVKASPMQA
jgi:NADH-quinone oxidoreductase subunit H